MLPIVLENDTHVEVPRRVLLERKEASKADGPRSFPSIVQLEQIQNGIPFRLVSTSIDRGIDIDRIGGQKSRFAQRAEM